MMMLHESIPHCASQARFETWSHNTLSHPGRKGEFSSIFRQHFPFNIRTVKLRSTPAKIITTAYYFLRHYELFELLTVMRSGLHPCTYGKATLC